jgi:hypothetical protein
MSVIAILQQLRGLLELDLAAYGFKTMPGWRASLAPENEPAPGCPHDVKLLCNCDGLVLFRHP